MVAGEAPGAAAIARALLRPGIAPLQLGRWAERVSKIKAAPRAFSKRGSPYSAPLSSPKWVVARQPGPIGQRRNRAIGQRRVPRRIVPVSPTSKSSKHQLAPCCWLRQGRLWQGRPGCGAMPAHMPLERWRGLLAGYCSSADVGEHQGSTRAAVRKKTAQGGQTGRAIRAARPTLLRGSRLAAGVSSGDRHLPQEPLSGVTLTAPPLLPPAMALLQSKKGCAARAGKPGGCGSARSSGRHGPAPARSAPGPGEHPAGPRPPEGRRAPRPASALRH